MKALLFLALAATLSAQETVSNGIRITSIKTTEGISVFVTASSCTTEAIRVHIKTSKQQGWDTQVETKPVFACIQRPVEFRFLLPGEVILISAYELTGFNSGSLK